jgi:hypothetical protein
MIKWPGTGWMRLHPSALVQGWWARQLWPGTRDTVIWLEVES